MNVSKIIPSFFAAALFTACGVNQDSSSTSSRTASESLDPHAVVTPNIYTVASYEMPQRHHIDNVVPPKEYYIQAVSEQRAALNSAAFSLADDEIIEDAKVLWLNFAGATVPFGFGRGDSFIVCEEEASIPAATFTPEQVSTMNAAVRSYYSDIYTNLTIVTEEPTEGNYTTVHVGGTIASLGCDPDDNVLGIAPLDRGNFTDNDVTFVFSGLLADETIEEQLQQTTVAIAHEAGHAFGLYHIDLPTAVMSPKVTDLVEGFKRGVTPGFFKRTQDSPQLLRSNLGVVADENGEFPEEEPMRSTFTDLVCNRIDVIQDYILDRWNDRLDGDEKFLDRPSRCE